MVGNLGNLGTSPLGSGPLGGTATPGFDYHAEATRIQTIFQNQNTSTAFPWLSQDLSTTVQTIKIDDPESTSIQTRNLPAIFIRARIAGEEFHAMGSSLPRALRARKEKLMTWEIFGIISKGGWRESNESFLESIHDFARNTEAIFQADPRLTGATESSKCLWVNPRRTDFGDVIVDGDILKGFRIDLEALYLFK